MSVTEGKNARTEPDLDSWELLNVIYVNSGGAETQDTIIYNGAIRPCEEGFCYSFRYRAREGGAFWGAGIVTNPAYAGMSPEEIVLTLTALYPVTDDDRRKAMDRLGIAEKGSVAP